MPQALVSGIYIIEFGLEYSAGANSAPTPDPLYLTRNRDGQQLTVEHGNPIGSLNKQWNILLPLEGENFKLSGDRIIIPVLSEPNEALAASQDIAKSPGEVCLIKNLQVWSFEPVREEDQLYQIQSNLYGDETGSIPLLGVDKEFKKVIIQSIPVNDDPISRPVWKFHGPITQK